MKKYLKQHALATQVLVRVFSIYFIVASFVTMVHMAWQYHDTKKFMAKEMEDTISMVSEGLGKALWEYNDGQVVKTLKGMELLPFVNDVTVTDTEGEIYSSNGKASDGNKPRIEHDESIIKYTAPIYIEINQGTKVVRETVGQLTLNGNNSYLYKRLELGIWLLITNALIKTLALWVIFMFVGRIFISRPLFSLTNAAKSLNLTDHKPVAIDLQSEQQNELTALASSFNDMSMRVFETKKQLEYKANYDGLTGLPNRHLFMDRLSQGIKLAKRNESILAVFYIDLDGFKEINDSLGHEVGDQVLVEVSQRLSKKLRKTDTLCRLGGDEFTIIIESLEDKISVVHIIQQLNAAMSTAIFVNNQALYATLSIGIAYYPDDADTPELLLKNADAAMYKAKDEGRNTHQFYTEELTSKALRHILMEGNLRAALENHEFVIYYQPQMHGDTNEIVGMEALVRWNHPKQGMIPPIEFISLAEKTGLIVPLGEEIFDLVSKQMAHWMKDSPRAYRVAINLSTKQLHQKDISDRLIHILEKNECDPSWIELEVTEGYVMKDPELAIQTLRVFANMNIEISIDDFGTGYSSLSYLKRLPISTLKIDQSFVRDLSTDENDKAIVKSIISLSRDMGLKVIAEGVEMPEQRSFLLENGCREMQGYLYSKPVPASEMEKLLQKQFIHLKGLT